MSDLLYDDFLYKLNQENDSEIKFKNKLKEIGIEFSKLEGI